VPIGCRWAGLGIVGPTVPLAALGVPTHQIAAQGRTRAALALGSLALRFRLFCVHSRKIIGQSRRFGGAA
jgi:hypothetical protein